MEWQPPKPPSSLPRAAELCEVCYRVMRRRQGRCEGRPWLVCLAALRQTFEWLWAAHLCNGVTLSRVLTGDGLAEAGAGSEHSDGFFGIRMLR